MHEAGQCAQAPNDGTGNEGVQQRGERVEEQVRDDDHEGCEQDGTDEAQEPNQPAGQLRQERPDKGQYLDEREERGKQRIEADKHHQPTRQTTTPCQGAAAGVDDLQACLGVQGPGEETVHFWRQRGREAHGHEVASAAEATEDSGALCLARQLVVGLLPLEPQAALLLLLGHAEQPAADQPVRQEAVPVAAVLGRRLKRHDRGGPIGHVVELHPRVAHARRAVGRSNRRSRSSRSSRNRRSRTSVGRSRAGVVIETVGLLAKFRLPVL
mmetsp:Transcript_52372/g.159153  ORF Transcript_52372/g.159153 Transcript_52372/m.159153 type:complete len:269 (+) Transcript_52372:110-916(+)